MGDQPRPSQTSSISARHVGLGPRLIDKDNLVGVNRKLRGRPLPTCLDYVLSLLLDGKERLFFRVCRSARHARLNVTSETSQSSSSLAAA